LKNKKIIVLAIITSILTLVMGGYIVYDKLIADNYKEDMNTDSGGNNIDELDNENDNNANKADNIISIIDLSDFSNAKSFKFLTIKNNGDCYVYFNINDEIGKELLDKYGSEYKILSNIKSATRVEYGNGDVETVVFIKNDGTLIALNPQSYMRSYRNDNYSIELITDFGSLKNIIEIKSYHSEFGTRIIAIDGNGSEYYIDTYLP